MEFLDSHLGVPALCVLVALLLVWKVFEFCWDLVKNKQAVSEKSIERLTESVRHLDSTMNEIKRDLAEIPKFKQDLRRLFSAVKHMAGDDWQRIRKEIMSDEFPM